MKFFRTFRQFLAGPNRILRFPSFEKISQTWDQNITVIQVFYIFVLFTSIFNLTIWNSHITGPELIPLWPLFWVKYLPLIVSLYLILGFQLISAVLGVFFCRYRSIRIFVFLGLLEYVALRGSYGKIGHSFHLLMLLSFLLIFLPRGWNAVEVKKRVTKVHTLLVFTACQFMIMLSYSLAGLGKTATAFYQMFIGQVNAFEPRALSLHIAQRLLETGEHSLFGPWLIDHYLYAWPMMQAVLYLQLFAIFVVLRPSLHRLWAFGLILFHIFSYFILTINFPFNCFLLGLFFLSERPAATSLTRMLADLPLFGMVFRRVWPKSV